MIDVRAFCRGVAEGFDREFFRHRPPFMSKRAFALGAVLWWGFLLSLLAALFYAAPSRAQVAGVCGSGKNCSVRRIETTNAQHGVSGVCLRQPASAVGGPYLSLASVSDARRGLYMGPACDTHSFTQYEVDNTSGVVRLGHTSGEYVATANGGWTSPRAWASFPACTGGWNGRLLYDSTNSRWRYCDGSNWLYLPISATGDATVTNGVSTAPWTAAANESLAAAPETTPFLGALNPRTVNGPAPRADVVACQWQTAGTGGTTGVVWELWNQTDSVQVCSCVVAACTAAARTPYMCGCEANLLQDKVYVQRLTAGTDCTANPQGMVCAVQLVPPI